MSYNPFLPAQSGYGVQYGQGAIPGGYGVLPAEEIDEDAIDGSRFDNVFIGGRYTPGKHAQSIDVSFANLDLDDAADFFTWLASDEGQDQMTRSLVSIFTQRGEISIADAINILADD